MYTSLFYIYYVLSAAAAQYNLFQAMHAHLDLYYSALFIHPDQDVLIPLL